jgi:hypothetical protein
MGEVKIQNFRELHKVFKKYRDDKLWLFRGHSDPAWKLLPKIGRDLYSGVDEKMVFNTWKRAAIEYVTTLPGSDWEWLAIAQHHGLATRLLDWTTNPLNACYFAVRESHDTDAILYAGKFKHDIGNRLCHPMDFERLAIYRPQRVVPRITRQGGMFTVHPKPTMELTKGIEGVIDLDMILIEKNYRELLLSELSFYGINSATLFPDFDGLAMFINWTIEKKEYWNYPASASAITPLNRPFG